MIYEPLAEILAQEVSEFVAEKTLFINQAPVSAEFCGIFRDNSAGFEIDGYLPTERSGTFTFVVRGKSQAEVLAAVKLASKALTLNGVTVGEYLIKICRPVSEPFSYKLSVGNLREISVNFSINYGIVQ